MGKFGYIIKPILKDEIAGTIRAVLVEGQEK
jgi:hypothetical protein